MSGSASEWMHSSAVSSAELLSFDRHLATQVATQADDFSEYRSVNQDVLGLGKKVRHDNFN